MVHFRTFLQAFTAGAVAVVGMTLAGPAWCGWLIMGIFLIVWAVNTRDLIRLERESEAAPNRPSDPPPSRSRVFDFPKRDMRDD